MDLLPCGYIRTDRPADPEERDGPADVIRESRPRIATQRLQNGLYEISVDENTAIGPKEPPDIVIATLAAEVRARRMSKRMD